MPIADLESFIARWAVGEGGQERANFALFLSEVPRPDQASHDAALNTYAFERAVTFRGPDGSTARGRIDLYKRSSFVLEAKQSRRPGTVKAEQSSLFDPEPQESSPLGRRTASRVWKEKKGRPRLMLRTICLLAIDACMLLRQRYSALL